MSAELVLAAIGAADLCLEYGKKLIILYQDFKHANEIVTEKVLIVEAIWSRTALQVDFVKRVAKTLEAEHCRIHIEVFEMLRSKLMIAISKLESMVKKSPDGGVKKWKIFFLRESLDEVINQLELWQRIFDPTWYLILRMSDKLIDSELPNKLETPTMSSMSSTETLVGSPQQNTPFVTAKSLRSILRSQPGSNVHISLPQDGLDWNNAAMIPYSTTRVVQRSGSSKQYLVDTVVCDSGLDLSLARDDAETLAKTLQQVDPGIFGLPICHGLVKRRDFETRQISSINLVFLMPSARGIPSTLRQRLMQPGDFSLTEVLNLARQLAKAVSFIHACNFVHKNIRPETILLFPDEEPNGKVTLGSACLLGFDSFRSINFQTLLNGDAAWDRNLYRHPSRQGLHAQEKYIMQHDVYSLGVCLLEIGLWNSFVLKKPAEDGAGSQTDRKLPSESLGLKVNDLDPKTKQSAKPCPVLKDQLVSLAKSILPMKMGDKYTAVVITCLTCLDQGNEDFGDEKEMQDEDGILIGVRFIEKVLFRLSEISF
ncbi:Fc.00g046070.m01.CDS01 [Cosmosporella sp. VM-42]